MHICNLGASRTRWEVETRYPSTATHRSSSPAWSDRGRETHPQLLTEAQAVPGLTEEERPWSLLHKAEGEGWSQGCSPHVLWLVDTCAHVWTWVHGLISTVEIKLVIMHEAFSWGGDSCLKFRPFRSWAKWSSGPAGGTLMPYLWINKQIN